MKCKYARFVKIENGFGYICEAIFDDVTNRYYIDTGGIYIEAHDKQALRGIMEKLGWVVEAKKK